MKVERLRFSAVVLAGIVLLSATFTVGLVYAQGSSDTGSANDCSSGVAVPDPVENAGLVSDCETLLAVRDTLAGSATLNWSVDIPIADWHGVGVDGTPQRVTLLTLDNRGLTGTLPAELGMLSSTQSTWFWDLFKKTGNWAILPGGKC